MKTNKHTHSLQALLWLTAVAALCLLSIHPLQGQVVVYSNNFNSASSDLTANFSESGQSSGTNFTWGSTVGVGGSGGVSVSGGPETAYYTTSVDGFSSSLTEYGISTYFRLLSNTAGTAGNLGFATGFLASTSDLMGNNSGTNTYLTLQAQIINTPSGEDTRYQFSFRSRSGSNSQTISTAAEYFTLTSNNWYRFETSYSFDSLAGTFSATGTLWDYGVDGTSLSPTQVATFTSGSMSNASFATDTEIYAAFRTGNYGFGGANRVDNFLVTSVPEPAAVGYLAIGLAAGLMGWRKRRHSLDA